MFMRKVLFVFMALLVCLGVARAEWSTNYDKALATAKSGSKRVLLDFTGSDWCGPCIQLNKQVFSTKEFRAYADKNLVLVEVDFPRQKKQSDDLVKQNEKLGKQYGIDEKGFPTLVLLDPSGRVIREFTGYGGESTTELIEWIEGKGGE
jgi:thioredoxin-related protein